MLVKLLGLVDCIGGLILIFISGVSVPILFFIFFGIIFLIKAGIGLLKDFASWIDFFVGVTFLLFFLFPVPWIICLIVGVLVLQKGFFSFL